VRWELRGRTCPRIAEIGKDAVAHVPRNESACFLDLLGTAAVVLADDVPEVLRVEPRRECRRSDKVSEHHRELTLLGLGPGSTRGSQSAPIELCNRAQHLPAMAERNADFLEILIGQIAGWSAAATFEGEFSNVTRSYAEGAVRLAYRREMEAIADHVERQRFFEAKTDHLYDVGTALNMASSMEIDAVIDPAQTQTWIVRGLRVTSSKSFENPGPGCDGFPIAASS
jgi:hypothetical protein